MSAGKSDPNVKYSRTLFGTNVVRYRCHSCGESLRSPLSDAGKQDECPVCHLTFVVPGADALRQFKKTAQLKKREEKEKSRAEHATTETGLEFLEYKLEVDLQLEEARLRVAEDKFKREFDAEQLEFTSNSRLRRTASMEESLVVFTQMTAEAMAQVQQKDWPPLLINETINKILKLRKQVNEAIVDNDSEMKERPIRFHS